MKDNKKESKNKKVNFLLFRGNNDSTVYERALDSNRPLNKTVLLLCHMVTNGNFKI